MTNKTDLTQFEGHIKTLKLQREIAHENAAHNSGYISQIMRGFRAVFFQSIKDTETLLSELKTEREENAALRAEVERLREVLEKLARLGSRHGDYGNSNGNMIARAALSSTGEEKG